MTDGYYLWEYEDGGKRIDVWTRDNQSFEIRVTDKVNWSSQCISVPGFDLAKSILTSVWGSSEQ